ncbi:MAG: hypothetical protein BMS9Abin05_0844 [Rhodothermia bacterium]|nr:MAG: hypothetical protein BMS9Abin05_0844 [Rhodothermia bacterium]
MLVLSLALSITSCQREFADLKPPEIEIIEPDVSTVLVDPVVTVRVKPLSDAVLTGISVGPIPMGFDPFSKTWTVEITLNRGLNRLIFRSFGEVDPPQQDTVDLFHMPFEVTTAGSGLRLNVGGHTTTTIPGGGVLVTGGSKNASGPALDQALLLPSIRDDAFIEVSASMLNARVGHTATLVSDRRIVILGGGSTHQISSVEDLVEAAEMYLVDDGIFVPLYVEGDPIRRMFHTALYRQTGQGPVIDLIGGTGDILYTPEPLLGTRADIRSFLLRNDTLVALSPAVGPFIERLSGHTQIDLGEERLGVANLYLVTGLGGGPPDVPVSIFVDYRSPLGILVDPAPLSIIPRYLHAASRMGFGLVGLFGGRDLRNGTVLLEAELYDHEITTPFKLPQRVGTLFRGRYSHTASIVAPNVIMLAGGFDESGNVVDDTEFLTFAF